MSARTCLNQSSKNKACNCKYAQRKAHCLGIQRLKQRAARVEDTTETVKNIRSNQNQNHIYFTRI